MTAEILTSIRELDSRVSAGIRFGCGAGTISGCAWRSLTPGEAFRLQVHSGEPPLDVFHHLYAYALHDIDTRTSTAVAPVVAGGVNATAVTATVGTRRARA